MIDKTVQFKSRARQGGFTALDNPVLLSAKLSAESKVLWGLLCFYAREDESCYPGKDRLASQVPCGVRTLGTYVEELVTARLVEVVRRGQGKTNVYMLGDLDHLTPAGSAVPDRQESPAGSAKSADQDQQGLPIPVETKTQETKTEGKNAGDARPCPVKVDRKSVTAEECALAWGVMDAFNAVAGSRFTAKGFVEKIIRRAREHPELDLAGHHRVISATFNGHHWWRGKPDPAIIYGSDEQFERSLVAASGSSGSSVQSGGVQTPSDGQDWNSTVRYE